ncbi:MAG: hypothetical protein ACPLPR_02015 [Bacillota bacterium]
MKTTRRIWLLTGVMAGASLLLLSWSFVLANRAKGLEASLKDVKKQLSASSVPKGSSGQDASWMMAMIPVWPDCPGLYREIVSLASAEGLKVTEVSFGERRPSPWKGLDFQTGRITAVGKPVQAVRLSMKLQELHQLVQVTGVLVETTDKSTVVGIDFRLILKSP